MGLQKLLKLHRFPSCFHAVGDLHSCEQRPTPNSTIKLVTSDGRVKTYRHSIPASALMEEFPKHLVCRSDAFYIGRKVPALSEHDLLEPGHNYFLLPCHFFQSVLTFVTVASFVAERSAARGSPGKKVAAPKPFDVLRTPSGSLRIHVSDEFISLLVEEGRTGKEESEEGEGEKGRRTRLCSTPQLERDYARLVEWSRSSGRWKPKLDTITESHRETSRRKRRTDRNFRCSNTPSSSSSSSVAAPRSSRRDRGNSS